MEEMSGQDTLSVRPCRKKFNPSYLKSPPIAVSRCDDITYVILGHRGAEKVDNIDDIIYV